MNYMKNRLIVDTNQGCIVLYKVEDIATCLVKYVKYGDVGKLDVVNGDAHVLAVASVEDANLKLLRSLPSAWNTHTLIMRNKSDLDTLSMDDLYNNLKGQASSSTYADDVMALRNQGNRNRDNTRRVVPVETPANALVVTDGMSYDWSYQAKEGPTDFVLMAHSSSGSSSSSSSDTKVHTCSKDCLKSFEALQRYLEEALKEKDDLKLKLEKFEESSKNLTKLINSQISAKDKTGLGYDSQMNESEVVHSVFNSRESDVDDSLVNDRFKTGEGFHAVPPPYTGNYMPSRPDLSFAGLDDSVYKTKVSETKTSISKTSKDIVEKPKTVRPSAPIIEEWDTNSDNDSVFRPKSDQTKPKFTKINFVQI
ncbi:hypothetical protein Tco_1172764 [Tanacetum coccineum]